MINLASVTRVIAMAAVATTLTACKDDEIDMTGLWLGQDKSLWVLYGGENKYLTTLTQAPCDAENSQVLSRHLVEDAEIDSMVLPEDRLADAPHGQGFVVSYMVEGDMLTSEMTGPMLRLPDKWDRDDLTSVDCDEILNYMDDPKGWAERRESLSET